MKIFFVNQFALRPSDKGSLRHYYLAKFLSSQGIDNEILTSSIHYNTKEQLVWDAEVETVSNVKFVCFKAPKYHTQISRLWNHIVFSLKVFWYLVRNSKKGDVVVGSSPQPFGAFAAYLAASLRGTRFFYEVRDLWPQTLIDLGGVSKNHLIVKVMGAIEKVLALKSEVILTVMPLAKDYFVSRYHVRPEKVIWLPQGVEVGHFGDCGGSLNAELFTIIYAGTIGVVNRIDFLLEVAKFVGEKDSAIMFQIYGDGPGRDEILQIIRDHKLRNVELKGAVPRNEVLAQIQKSHLAVVLAHSSPLYKYGIGYNKIFDYFLCGKAVLFVGDVAQNPIMAANAGWVSTSQSAEEVADIVLSISKKSKDEILAFGQNGYKYLKMNHDIEITGTKLKDVIWGTYSRAIV